MSQFVYHRAGNTEAQQKLGLSFLLRQDSTGSATDGVLTGLGVAQTATASASVVVGRGSGASQDSLLSGASMLVLDTDLTLDVLGANPMGGVPRNDIVVFDSATLSGAAGGVRVIVGTPNAVPTDPTVPATAIPLARLRHAASATTVPSSKIDDLRAWTGLFGTARAYTECRSLRSAWSKAVSAATVTNVQWDAPTTNTLGLTQTDAATFTVPTGKAGLYSVTVSFAFAFTASERRFVELYVTSAVTTYRNSFYADSLGSVSATLRLEDGDGLRVQCFSATAATASAGQWTIARIGN